MEDSFISGSFDLIIRGENLDPNEIAKNINLKPSKLRKKGELITKDIKMKDSYWCYGIRYQGYNQLNQAIEELLLTILPYKDFVDEISEIYDVYISFGLRSNLGQLGFDLQPNILRTLAQLNIRFEVHILSYGEVDRN